MPDIDIARILFQFIAFLFSLTIHEAAHAWTSERFGDDTGRYEGRISLNPAVHIDPLGTIIFPLVGMLGGGWCFGWAKPVPVDPTKWRDHFVANIAVSGAGPASNVVLAVISVLIIKVLVVAGLWHGTVGAGGTLTQPHEQFLMEMIAINVLLAAFNMLPIPPLDGSHILSSLLSLVSRELTEAYESIRPFGFVILIALSFTGILGILYRPLERGMLKLLYFVFYAS